jgi:hypothetical protein
MPAFPYLLPCPAKFLQRYDSEVARIKFIVNDPVATVET